VQAQLNPRARGGPPTSSAGRGALGRAIRYLGNQRRSATIAYGALVVATAAQLAVPQLVQSMIDAVTSSSGAPAAAERVLFGAAGLILLFALLRGVFSFLQAFMSESTSQGVAFDLRNAIFEKIQRLSFSYYDQNQTGQLMVRA
jgi:ATP-binding cassette subfamily B protein